MYHRNPHSGDTPDYWANTWDEISFDESLRQCLDDPLRPLFEKYVQPDSLILEGGCGIGHWVAYFKDRGYSIVGLDFSHRTLAELKTRRDGLWLCSGNVNSLPFADETFDIYYSGGVVEHFESGCEDALAEARRVIKKGGKLLLSVPFFSPLRRYLLAFRRNEWATTAKPRADGRREDDLTYFQYAYHREEFIEMLRAAGLDIVETVPYGVTWGLYDIDFLSQRARKKNISAREKATPVSVNTDPGRHDSSTQSRLKSLVIGEKRDSVVERLVTNILQRTCANMMMYVCTRT